MAKEIERLQGYIATMMNKTRGQNDPGYLHFRVLSDYIREAVERKQVTWAQLQINEAKLCKLEIDCLEFGTSAGYEFENWMKPALEAKLKKAIGTALTPQESANIIELFPAEEDQSKAA